MNSVGWALAHGFFAVPSVPWAWAHPANAS